MLRENFFYKFFNRKHSISHQLVKYNSNIISNLQGQINDKIIEIDRKIYENNKALVQAQVIQLKYKISKTNNFFDQIGRNVYQTKLDETISWHKEKLKELYFERKELQINLEKIQGIFWLNQFKRYLKLLGIVFLIFINISILLSGFMIIIYLLPLIILISLGYIIINILKSINFNSYRN